MLELADIFRLHGPDYRAKFSTRMLPAHLRAMQDIERCRTEALGGQLYYCAQCDEQRYSYHSCKNRHCPKCQNEQANDWLKEQKDLLLPTQHFLVTFTLPAELRAVARSNQKTIYNLLFRASSQALLQLAQDPRFVGARLGMVGVLHTWTRQLRAGSPRGQPAWGAYIIRTFITSSPAAASLPRAAGAPRAPTFSCPSKRCP